MLTDPEAARTLMNVAFLGQFREPASPSDVARKLEMPANLAHHHAHKCERLGLLFQAGREKGKVLYQLSALRFKIPRHLAGEGRGQFERSVRQLAESYLLAYEKSESYLTADAGHWSVCTFITDETNPPPAPLHQETDEPRPALYTQRTVKLTAASYKRLLSRLNALVQELESERDECGAATCTVAVLGFEGVAHEGLTDDSLSYSSFFTPEQEEKA